ncbi:MAG: transposase [Hyphomicrobiales bacterium]|nr:transposase [Hyphomicrobiales bacterium]
MSFSNDAEGTAPRRRRRAWTTDEKRRIVDESLEDDASLAEVARRHDLNANQLFTWRRQFGVEPVAPRDLAPILPVTIASEIAADDLHAGSRGQMEIVLADGERIIVWSDVETAALTRVLKALARR